MEKKINLIEEEFLDQLVQAEKIIPDESYGDEDQDSIMEQIDSSKGE